MKIASLIILLAIGGKTRARARRDVSGVPIPIEEAPYLVSLRSGNTHVCNGVLANSWSIFTVGECLRFNNFTVRAGVDKNNVNGVLYGDAFHVTDDETDVAMIRLSRDVEFNAREDTINFPYTAPSYHEKAQFYTFRSDGTSSGKTQPHRFPVKIAPYHQCTLNPLLLCASRINNGLQDSDMGGVLALNNRMLGLAVPGESFDQNYETYVDMYKFLESFPTSETLSRWIGAH